MQKGLAIWPRESYDFGGLMNWVKLKKYCELSGDTTDAVHAKRRKGIWLDEKQCRLAPDGNLWINLMEVEKWVQNVHSNVRRA